MVAATEVEISSRTPRLAALDVIRGVAILAMIVYHAGWDLSAYGLIAVDVAADPVWRTFARLIAGTFIGIVGINLVMATRNGLRLVPYLRRLAIIIAAAVLVTIGTWWFLPGGFVYFGILHCIALASVLALPFLWAPVWLVAGTVVIFLAGPHFLASPFFDSWWFYWLGLSTAPPPSVDYVPLFPWFGIVLLGLIAGRLLVRHRDGPLWNWRGEGPLARFLAAAGRWSLAIYLIHQPVLLGILFVVTPLLGPSEAALSEQLATEYDASCAVAGYDEVSCEAYARCIVAGLQAREGLLVAAHRQALTADEVGYWEIVVAECRAKTLPPAVAGGI